jgi:hypothetical protein
MNKRLKLTSGIAVILIFMTLFFIYQEMYKVPDAVNSSVMDIVISSEELAAFYRENESSGDTAYLGKVIVVTGEVIAVEKEKPVTVIMKGYDDTQVRVQLEALPSTIPAPGTIVTLRGACSGFLLDVVLTNASFIDE